MTLCFHCRRPGNAQAKLAEIEVEGRGGRRRELVCDICRRSRNRWLGWRPVETVKDAQR